MYLTGRYYMTTRRLESMMLQIDHVFSAAVAEEEDLIEIVTVNPVVHIQLTLKYAFYTDRNMVAGEMVGRYGRFTHNK